MSFGIGFVFLEAVLVAGGAVLAALLGLAVLSRLLGGAKLGRLWAGYFVASAVLFSLVVVASCPLVLALEGLLPKISSEAVQWSICLAALAAELAAALALTGRLSRDGIDLSEGLGNWCWPVLMLAAAGAFWAFNAGKPDALLGVLLPIGLAAVLAIVGTGVSRASGWRPWSLVVLVPILAAAAWTVDVMLANWSRAALVPGRLAAIQAVMPCRNQEELALVARFERGFADFLSPPHYELPLLLDLRSGAIRRAFPGADLYRVSWSGHTASFRGESTLSLDGSFSVTSGLLDLQIPALVSPLPAPAVPKDVHGFVSAGPHLRLLGIAGLLDSAGRDRAVAWVFRPDGERLVGFTGPGPGCQPLAASEDGMTVLWQLDTAPVQEPPAYRLCTAREDGSVVGDLGVQPRFGPLRAWLFGPAADIALLRDSENGTVLDLVDVSGKLRSSTPLEVPLDVAVPEPVWQRASPYRATFLGDGARLVLYDTRNRRLTLLSLPREEGPQAALVGTTLYYASARRVMEHDLSTGQERQLYPR